MTGESKFFIGIGVITLVLIVTGVVFFGNQKPKASVGGQEKVDTVSGAIHTVGNADSKVKIVEFGDYQCPACGAAYPIVKSVIGKNKDKIFFAFRNFPLSAVHPNARDSARAAEAAGEQGKFWEMHDLLYEKQSEWSSLGNAGDKFKEYAQSLGLDMKKYAEDFDKVIARINDDASLGDKAGIDSTPTFFVNDVKYPGVLQESQLQQLIDDASK